jgi:hypothetical protein
MNKKYLAIKLLPSRPDFAENMTDYERICNNIFLIGKNI